MPIQRINIEEFVALSDQSIVIDVRSPSEYEHAHFPGSYNCPLFSNHERSVVGTAYKQKGREDAIKIGLDFFGPKMKKIVEEIESLVVKQKIPNQTLLIYCWRGGMRSAAIAWLLDLYGFKIYTLAGGYKRFRNFVLEMFRQDLPINLIGGYTGSGKTEVLKELESLGEIIVNLEQIANHKGSAFGNIGMPAQPTQEMFENLLALEILRKNEDESKRIWLEDESQRIGHVNIPNDLWKSMRSAPVYFLEIPFEQRLDHIVSEYGSLNTEKVIDAIGRISQRLGGLEAKNATELLQMGKTRESFRILLTYYDRWYLKGLHNRQGLDSLLHTVQCESVNPLNAKKLLRQPELI